MKRIIIVSLLGAMLSGCGGYYYSDDGYRHEYHAYYGHSYYGHGYYGGNQGSWDHGQ